PPGLQSRAERCSRTPPQGFPMKCLSLWQPWASLVVLGAKRIETRSWSTQHRGPLAIHAAKKWEPNKILALIDEEPYRSALGEHRGNLPLGCILGTVNVTDCFELDHFRIAVQQAKEFGSSSVLI